MFRFFTKISCRNKIREEDLTTVHLQRLVRVTFRFVVHVGSMAACRDVGVNLYVVMA